MGIDELLDFTTIEEFNGTGLIHSSVTYLTLRMTLKADFFDNRLEDEFWTKLGVVSDDVL